MAKHIFDQLNTKTITTLSSTDLDTIFKNVHIESLNVESLNKLKLIKEVAGFTPGTPFKGTQSIKAVTLTGEGSDNKKTIYRPEPGQVWEYIQSSIEVAVFDAGQANFRILTYDGSNFVCHVEYSTTSTSITQEPLLNEQTSTGSREGGFNNRILFDYDNYLVCYFDSSGSATTDPVINTAVVRVN
jgi:hypothetical protein